MQFIVYTFRRFRHFLLTHIHLVECELTLLQSEIKRACVNRERFVEIVYNVRSPRALFLLFHFCYLTHFPILGMVEILVSSNATLCIAEDRRPGLVNIDRK